MVQINSYVTSSSESAVIAIRLLEKQRRSRMRARETTETKEQNGEQAAKAPHIKGSRCDGFCESLHLNLMTKSPVGFEE
jgi:hypothetical protein